MFFIAISLQINSASWYVASYLPLTVVNGKPFLLILTSVNSNLSSLKFRVSVCFPYIIGLILLWPGIWELLPLQCSFTICSTILITLGRSYFHSFFSCVHVIPCHYLIVLIMFGSSYAHCFSNHIYTWSHAIIPPCWSCLEFICPLFLW